MITYLRKVKPKNKWALFFSLVIVLIFLCSISPASSGILPSPLDGIASSIENVGTDIFATLMTYIIRVLADPFSPQLDTYVTLSNGGNFAWDSLVTYDDSVYKSNIILNWIVTFSQRTGTVISMILILVLLLLCVFGRSEQIRDSPIALFVKFCICVFVIYNSWYIILHILHFAGDLWTRFIMSSAWSTTDSSVLNNGDVIGENHLSYVHFVGGTDSPTALVSGVLGITGFTAKIASSALWSLFFAVFGIFIVWKLFKSFLRLLLEVAERYFVFTVLLFFFPAVVPACISNMTISIFHAYVRMLVSQTILILVNGLFLKIFVFILMKGGWTNSITGYICSFAYLRVCMRFDTYLLTIGMNAAQTGGGFLESLGGATLALTSAIRGADRFSEMRHNLGTTTMQKGLESADRATYERGARMATPFTPFSKFGSKAPDSFEVAMAKTNGMPGDRKTDYSYRRQGEQFAVEKQGSMSSISEAAGKAGLTSNQTTAFVNELEKHGIKKEQIAGFRQIDGTKEYSSTAGNTQCAYDKDGHSLGFHSNINGSDNYYVSDTQTDEIERYESNTKAQNYLDTTADGEEDVKAVLGNNVNRQNLIRVDEDNHLGTQTYRYTKYGDDKVYEAEVSSASFHLEKVNNKGYALRSDTSGRDFLIREQVVPPETDQPKKPRKQ